MSVRMKALDFDKGRSVPGSPGICDVASVRGKGSN